MNTPQEEAERLVNTFFHYEPVKLSEYTNVEYPSAINFAKFVVDEILQALKYDMNNPTNGSIKYYNSVKQELDKL